MWRTKSGRRFLSHGWWHQNIPERHPIETADLGTYWRLRLEHMYGIDMDKWPNEVGVQLRRTTHHNKRDHTSFHEYQEWLENNGWEVAMMQNTLQEGRYVRLRRRKA